ncbi:MAG: type II secretion system protein [Verrucomicrobiia bacterium]
MNFFYLVKNRNAICKLKRWRQINTGAYTLIEIIGVLAILTIIVSILAPYLFKRVTEAHINQETQLLALYEKAFKENVIRTRRIPDQNGWASVVANELGISTYDATNVFKNKRIFLIDPLFKIGPNLTGLPYTQGTNGSLRPQNPRVMIISSLGPPLPEPDGVSANFNTIWNTPDGQIPSVWQSGWKGKGEFLIIRRIGMESLFRFVIISNLDPTNEVFISVDDSPPFRVTRDPAGFSGFFFRDTVFKFYDPNGLMVSAGVLNNNYSYVFENGEWRGKLLDGRMKLNQQFQQAYTHFLAAPRNPDAKFGAKQINILEFFCEYSRAYTIWSLEGFVYKTSQEQYPAEEQLQDYQALLSQTARDLIW